MYFSGIISFNPLSGTMSSLYYHFPLQGNKVEPREVG